VIRVLIVDDEKPAREVLKTYLGAMAGVEIAGEAESGKQAIAAAEALRPDLVLLDVQMSGMDGIEAAGALPPGTGVIFVTAYDTYAIKAFELHAFDYILKPVMRDRLESAVKRAGELIAAGRSGGPPDTGDIAALLDFFKAKRTYASRLTIRSAFEYVVLDTCDISCIKVEDGLVFVYSKGIKYAMDTPLKKLEQRLDPSEFLRVHRSALVNKNRVKKMYPWKKGHYAVETDAGDRLLISRDHLAQFKIDMGWEG
jgi:two-component system LytT family response regulator